MLNARAAFLITSSTRFIQEPTIFEVACAAGHVAVAEWLIGKGLDIKQMGPLALSAVIKRGTPEMIAFLASKGVDATKPLGYYVSGMSIFSWIVSHQYGSLPLHLPLDV